MLLQDIPEEMQNDFKQPGDRFRKMNPREYVYCSATYPPFLKLASGIDMACTSLTSLHLHFLWQGYFRIITAQVFSVNSCVT